MLTDLQRQAQVVFLAISCGCLLKAVKVEKGALHAGMLACLVHCGLRKGFTATEDLEFWMRVVRRHTFELVPHTAVDSLHSFLILQST